MPGWPEWSLSTVLARRPAVRINQLSYLPHGPKRATWVTNEPLPVEFTVVALSPRTRHRLASYARLVAPGPDFQSAASALYGSHVAPRCGRRPGGAPAKDHRYRVRRSVAHSSARSTSRCPPISRVDRTR